MRLLCLLAFCSWIWIGCAGNKSASQPGAAASDASQAQAAMAGGELVVTPGGSVSGTVALVNPGARYAVVSFPIGAVPAENTQLNVYRNGLKVGEIKITGPARDNNTVGDIIAGEARKGDELRRN